jgi:hypothetical protein
VVEFVNAIIAKKIFECSAQQRLVAGVAKGAAHEGWRAIAYVTGNHFTVELRASDIVQHRVDGMNQIEAGIDQSAIEIKDEKPNAMRIEAAKEMDHGEFRITQVQLSAVSSQVSVNAWFQGWKGFC